MIRRHFLSSDRFGGILWIYVILENHIIHLVNPLNPQNPAQMMGNVMINSTPSPGVFLMLILPRWALMISYDNDNPRPGHSSVGFVVKNGWNTLSSTFSGIPFPFSATLISSSPFIYFFTHCNSGFIDFIDYFFLLLDIPIDINAKCYFEPDFPDLQLSLKVSLFLGSF